MDSYRPIALTNCLCNLLEKMINLKLTFYLEQDKILLPSQLGFRKMKSTVYALAKLETDILQVISFKKHIVAVFYDTEKAHDTT